MRWLLRLTLIASQLLIASTIVAQNPIWRLPNKKAIPPEPAKVEEPLPEESWRTPSVACSLLDESGLPARGWKNVATTKAPDTKDYSCSSPSAPLNAEIPLVAGFIAYYAEGSADNVRQLKLVLNVHDPRFVELGSLSLAAISHALTLRALDRSLPIEIITALHKAEPGHWKIGANEIEVQREAHAGAAGYDLKFLIR